ncbi:putative GTP-binding protein alpha subunit gna [Tripterygium wilfordii]|uniref:Putative GTP-binding protein alpha subunit gna n=1 Tax=Tripterygium wilfordii TaxID=458696 RepID=A0A7J7DGZ8_TRIWF|nr:extra-large guanine nucleotide-binding protein 1-like [Tripterygium wilfordii]KAF5745650.1 putative GTP-binding protein alpha subunit gna [Tripterygium wilfordii]
MAQLLRKIFPVEHSVPKEEDDDDYGNIEYSFAVEYLGPPVTYDIPQALPVDIERIPIAAPAVSASLLNNLSLPVIQPIVKSKPSTKKRPQEPKFCSEATVSPITTEVSSRNGVLHEPSDAIDSSDAFGNAKNNGDHLPELCNEKGDPVGLRFCNCDDNLREVCGSSHLVESRNVCTEDAGGFQDYMSPNNCKPSESGLSSHSVSSEIFSFKVDDCDNVTVDPPGHAKKPSIVTFRDPEFNYFSHEESHNSATESIREEDCHNVTVDPPGHVERPSIVTFRDPEFRDLSHEEYHNSATESINVAREVERIGKKGTCYRCLKGNRLTEKEICIVCGAKYCFNCVLRAMGSMPEGRKCITCIGKRINEGNRRALGKCSRMLKRLLTEMEVKQRMKSERFCEVNQLPAEFVYVNDEPLSQGELVLLQTCPNPPKKLKPGHYWYDEVSGFWGKVGEKPCQIISSHLNVGGHMKKNASNGDTNILINNREITKAELRMLKAAGAQCEGTNSFWLNDDGSYQDEGMNNVKGRIWGKTRVNLVCAALSLPIPPSSGNPGRKNVDDISQNCLEQKIHGKLLLVGYRKSGSSTIFKQARLLHSIPFTEDERQNFKFMIQRNLYAYIGILLEGREKFEQESLIERRKRQSVNQCGPSDNMDQKDDNTIYSIGPKLKAFADWLLKVMASGNLEAVFPPATREYAPFVEKLWNDTAFQATYNRRDELEMLSRVATYFLERAVEISRPDYEPSDMDILHAEVTTSLKGIPCLEFELPNSAEMDLGATALSHDSITRYQLIRVHPRNLGENCKWLEMFEDVDVVMFCVSLTDYSEFLEDSRGVTVNKMLASKQLLESIVTHPNFDGKDYLLILNKFDLLTEIIERVPLTQCEWFHDFNPVINPIQDDSSRRYCNLSLAHRAFQYMAIKFKRFFHSLTGRKLYVSLVHGMKPDSVDYALKFAREIMVWNEVEPSYTMIEASITSIEQTTSS